MHEVVTGDCLEVLPSYPSGSFDLAYLDPPFFTQKTHRLSSRDESRTYQFADEWESLTAYLDFVRARLFAVKQVMKDTATVYLHCDHTAAHHLRLLLDEVFGAEHFLAEIIWTYRRWSNSRDGLLPAHQNIFMYRVGDSYTFNRLYEDYSAATNLDQILQRRHRNGNGKAAYARDEQGEVILNGPKAGVPLADVWDIPYLNPKAKERSGYPTQKPLLLLERIVRLSSNPGDVVLEPFSGSGTAAVAAYLLGRGYLAIDVSPDATALTRVRLEQPIRTRSRLLEVGRDAYEELPEEVKAILATLPVKPVQRNAGIDAIGDQFIAGKPVLVRVQRSDEPLTIAACKLREAGAKKNAALLVLIQTESDVWQSDLFGDSTADLAGICVIVANALSYNQVLAQHTHHDSSLPTHPSSLQPMDFYNANSLIINLIAINAVLALSIYITLSAAMLSLANAAFMGIGAYVAVLITQYFGWSLIPAGLVGAGVAALVGTLLGAPVLRLRGVFLAIATVGFGEILRIFILNYKSGLTLPFQQQPFPNGAEGLRIQPPAETNGWLTYGTVIVLAYFFWRLRDSRMGLALAAIREDEAAAASSGINVTQYRLIAFVIGAFIAGWAGAMYAHLYNFVSPGDFGFQQAVNILVFAVVGGTLGWPGPILGALLITSLPELLRFSRELREVFTGLILLLTILFLPSGLFSLLGKALGIRRRPPVQIDREPLERTADEQAKDETSTSTKPVAVPTQNSKLRTPNSELLRTESVTRRFGGVVAVDDVSISIATGSIYGLIGPNGAGKTTLLNLLSGVLPATSGHIYLQGQRVDGLPPHQMVKRGVARTYQNIRLFPTLTVAQNVLVGMHSRTRTNLLERLLLLPSARNEERASLATAVQLLHTLGLADRFNQPAASLPYGDQRRLEIARALASQPILLLLDEPAAGLNQSESARLRDLLRSIAAEGRTILLIEHDMALVMSVCDDIAVLNFGRKIAEDTPATISHDPVVIEAYLGSD